MPAVVVQKWEESELGWGQHDDGFSIHLTEEDRFAFIKEMPKGTSACYIHPCGEPYLINLRANSVLYKKLLSAQFGLYRSEKAPVGYRKVS